MSKRGVGLALLAVASLYQLKRARDAKEASIVVTPGKPTSESKVKRKTPIQIIKDEIARRERDEVKEIIDIEENSTIYDTSETPDIQLEKVFTVGKGKKYHLSEECRAVKSGTNTNWMSEEEAIEKGYTMCAWEKKDMNKEQKEGE